MYGFFRQDDFSFLQVAREFPNLGSQIFLRHNDHTYPLYRLQVWGLTQLAGPMADAGCLAGWFNGLTLVTCLSLLLSMGWLLHELGGSKRTVYLMIFGLWVWSGWGEFTSGYYTLAVYLQVQALAAAAAAAALRGRVKSGWFAISLLFVGLALALNSSGVVAFVAASMFSLALPTQEKSRQVIFYRMGLGVIFLIFCLSYLFISHHPPAPRELVQNPSGVMLESSIFTTWREKAHVILPTFFTAIGGTAINGIIPTFLQFRADALMANLPVRRFLFVIELAVTAGLVALGWRGLKQLCRQEQRFGIVLATVWIATLAMVVLARGQYAAAYPAVLWNAKYMVMPVSWFCLLVFYTLDRVGATVPRPHPWLTRFAFFLIPIGLWMVFSFWQAEKALLPDPISYSPRGRWGNVENAKKRRIDYAQVMKDLVSMQSAASGAGVVLPPTNTWEVEFFREYPCLEWGTDVRPRGVTYLFADLPAATPVLSMNIKYKPVLEMSHEQRARLQTISWLKPSLKSN